MAKWRKRLKEEKGRIRENSWATTINQGASEGGLDQCGRVVGTGRSGWICDSF